MATCCLFVRGTFSLLCVASNRLFLALALAGLAGCGGAGRTDDPQLKPIQSMLEAQLPPHTPEEKVIRYLDNNGYSILAAQKQGTIVAIIRRKDTAAVQPVSARVTFYFDANRRLNTFELQRPSSEPARH